MWGARIDGRMKNIEDVPLFGKQLRNIFDVFVGGGCRHHPIYKYGANHNASSSTISQEARVPALLFLQFFHL